MAGLNAPVRLEKWSSAKDGSGDSKESVDKYNLWAEILTTNSSKGESGSRSKLVQTVQFRVRFRPDFKPTGNWRVVYDGKRYTVESIEKSESKRFYWVITASGF